MKKKLIVLTIGTLTTFIIFELCLRIVSYDFNDHQIHSINKADYKILALGNSYTYGSGAEKNFDYPTQLEKLLNQRKTKTKTYSVINKGIRNGNTRFILNSLPEWLSQIKPQQVFMMVGEPNYWNRFGYWDYIKNKNILDKDDNEFLLQFLRYFKTYKFFEIISSQQKKFSNTFLNVPMNTSQEKIYLGYLWLGTIENNASFNFMDNDLTKEQIQESLEMIHNLYINEENIAAANVLANYYLNVEKNKLKAYKLLKPFLNRKIKLDVRTYDNLLLIEDFSIDPKLSQFLKNNKPKYYDTIKNNSFQKEILQNNMSLKEKNEYVYKLSQDSPSNPIFVVYLFKNALFKHPDILLKSIERIIYLNPLAVTGDLFQRLDAIKLVHPSYTKKVNEILNYFTLKFNHIDLTTLHYKPDKIDGWVESDIEEMVNLILKSKVKLVIQTYPRTRNGSQRAADIVIRQWWNNRKDKTNIQFQDVEKDLFTLLETKNGGEKYYATHLGPDDNHLNNLGYLEIAKSMSVLVP